MVLLKKETCVPESNATKSPCPYLMNSIEYSQTPLRIIGVAKVCSQPEEWLSQTTLVITNYIQTFQTWTLTVLFSQNVDNVSPPSKSQKVR